MTRRSQNKAPRLERCGACFVLSPTAGWRVATATVLPITRIIGDVATEVHGRCVARRMIRTGLARSLPAVLADEPVRLGRLRETPAGEVRPYAPEADARSHAGKIGCLALTITRNADPGGEGASPPQKRVRERGYMYYSARIPPGGMHIPLYPRGVWSGYST